MCILQYLGVLHDTVNAVKVWQLSDCFCRVLQHPLHWLHTNTAYIPDKLTLLNCTTQLSVTQPLWLKCIDCLWFSLLLLLYSFRDFYDPSGTWEAKEKIKKRNCLMVAVTSSSLRALSHSFWPGACWVHMVMSWLIVSVTALQRQMIRQISG